MEQQKYTFCSKFYYISSMVVEKIYKLTKGSMKIFDYTVPKWFLYILLYVDNNKNVDL